MNLEHLRTFITVAHTLHFSRAAKILHLSQPAISHHIHALEEFFQQPLFERRAREVYLTPFAMKLLPRVEKMLALYQDIEALSLKDDSSPLTIETSNTIGEYMLADIVSRFIAAENIPANRLITRVTTTYEALQSLEYEKSDIALIEGKVGDPVFQSAVFSQDEMIPVVSPSYPLKQNPSLEDLTHATWVMREEGCMMRKHTETFVRGLGIPYDKLNILSMNNNRLLRQSVINGLGIGLLSRRTIEKELKDGSLIRIMTHPPSYHRPLHIVRRSGALTTYIARRFWDFVVNALDNEENGMHNKEKEMNFYVAMTGNSRKVSGK